MIRLFTKLTHPNVGLESYVPTPSCPRFAGIAASLVPLLQTQQLENLQSTTKVELEAISKCVIIATYLTARVV